ncbi:MAG: tetratricopeptide repeat protein [Parvularculaceae bacterium]
MTVRDCFDLPMTGVDAEGARGYENYVGEYLSYGAQLRDLFSHADAAPESAMLNAHAAALHLAFEGAEGWANAAPYIARMNEAAIGASERERLFCAAVNAWSRRDFIAALDELEELTVRWPADLCALKWGQYHAFNLGDQPALLRFAERARVVHEGRPYVHGMISFALEQNHRLGEAEEEGLKAVEIAIDDAWAHHAVAHVMLTEHRAADGVRWLDHCAHTWERKGVFIRDHNWWHAAVFKLELGQLDEALAIYDARLWGSWPEFPQEQIGAVSMLWRLELRGVDVGDRWAPVVSEARKRAGEHLLPFHDIHYLYALARAGEPAEAEAFLASIEGHSRAQFGPARAAWAEACLPAARGVLALARGDDETAAAHLASALPELGRIGGSHAQRHLFAEAFEAATAQGASWPARTG